MQALRLPAHTAVILLVLCAGLADATDRDRRQVRAFQRTDPCPSTGKPRGPCPGWIVDHVVPLCAGGADRPVNMQWQTVAAARLKDRGERAVCRALRLHP